MSARNPNTSSGASSPLVKLIPIAVIVLVVLIGIYFFFLSGGSKAPAPVAGTQAPAAGAAPAAAPAATAEAPPPAVPDLSPEQLLREAGTAFRENRLVAPAGNNALEYYLALLDKQPNNATARDALREMFPIVTGAVEQNINSGAVDEATRVINLLAKADPSNYTLTILRSKLDAKKKTVEREQAVAAAAAAAAAAKGQQPAAAAANTAAPAPAAASASAAPPPAESTAGAAAPPKSTTTAPATAAPATTAATAAPPPAAGGDTRAAEILKTTAPDYPPDAVRKRQEGWVEVEFTVMPDGSVANASVVNANPARVFNSSALRAVERWTFKPRVENGKPAEEKMRRRIEFKL